jgi:iron complex outermembrane receptor protein
MSGLEDIVVTAQRRAEKLQDIPLSVTAFSSKDLSSQRIDSTQGLTNLVPTLHYARSAGFPQPTIRGVGNNNNGPNYDPEVATYQDGIYIANNGTSILDLVGVDRVEVLSGPQGTLYGRNATGGAINVITKTPSSTPEGELNAGYGNYNRAETRGYISGGITDHLSAGLYAGFMRHDSYNDKLIAPENRTIPGTPNDESSWGIRGKIRYQSEDVKITLSAEHSDSRSLYDAVLRNATPNALGIVAKGATFSDTPYVDRGEFGSFLRVNSSLVTLAGEFDLGPFDLYSLSGVRSARTHTAYDGDGLPVEVADATFFGRLHSYSQELRLQSKPASKLKWIVGLYGYKETSGFDPYDLISSVAFTSSFGPGLFAQQLFPTIKTTSWAAFAQATYPLMHNLNLTVGVRYSDDKKTFNYRQSFFPVTQGANGYYVFGTPFGASISPTHKASWSKPTPKATLDYHIGGTMLYATYAKGYKSGAFNPTSPTTPPVAPETLDSYEIGTKSDISPSLRINTAAYLWGFTRPSISTGTSGATFSMSTTAFSACSCRSSYTAKMTRASQF